VRGWPLLLLGVGCSVPVDEDVLLRRFCTGVGVEFQDAALRLAGETACDRGLSVEVISGDFRPGCVQVSLQDIDRRLLGATQLKGPSQVTPEQSRGLRIFLSEAQGISFGLTAVAYPNSTCDGEGERQVLRWVEVPKGTVRDVQIDVSRSDADGDGYVSTATGGTDCDDTNAAINPAAVEVCDGVDNNCVDGEADAPGFRTWFLDRDGDGYGGEAVEACVRPTGTLANQGGDCNDQNPFINPGQSESRCDGLDDNCDGNADEGLPVFTWYRDADGDGYGDVTQAVTACGAPAGHVAIATDCNDSNPNVHPGAAEANDFQDNNCNGAIDEGVYPGPRLFSEWEISLAVTTAGSAWAWGLNRRDLLGDGVVYKQPTRIHATALPQVSTMALGYAHVLASLKDGTVMAWGLNEYGQLGSGTEHEVVMTPRRIPGLNQVITIAAAYNNSAALKQDGTVWTWGAMDVDYDQQWEPAQVMGLTGIISISATYNRTLALRSDGTVWLLYRNQDPITRTARVPELTDVVAIASGGGPHLALKKDGTVWSWQDLNNPTRVPNLTAITAIQVGNNHSLAVKQDGTIWAWGSNDNGQLGDGTTVRRNQPVQITGLTDVSSVAAGEYHSLAVKRDGSVWAWGDNGYAQVNDSSEFMYTVPTRRPGTDGLD
jgi:alpha-tubulin suppressor-like RCC1 family protein